MLKDPNPKIVGLTLRIIENVVHEIKDTDPELQVLISVIIEKLGDQKISIRQIVSKVIKELIVIIFLLRQKLIRDFGFGSFLRIFEKIRILS